MKVVYCFAVLLISITIWKGNAEGIRDPKPAGPKPFDPVRINHFIGISPDFKVYAIRPKVSTMEVLDLETRKSVKSPEWKWGSPLSLAFGNNAIAVVTSGYVSGPAHSVKVFSRKTGELEQNINCEARAVAFTTDGRLLAIGVGRELILRDIQEKKTIAKVALAAAYQHMSLAVAGKWVAVYEPYNLYGAVLDAKKGTIVKNIKGSGKGGTGQRQLAISPTGNLLAYPVEDDVILYDFSAEKIVHKLEGHLGLVRGVAFFPDGKTVVSTAQDGTMRFWNVKNGKEVRVIKKLPLGASNLIVSTDGRRILFADGYDSNGSGTVEIRSVKPIQQEHP
jgi:WD40 repeat protein